MTGEATERLPGIPAIDPLVEPAVRSAARPVGSAGELGRRNDRLLVGAIAAYVILLSALMIVRGVAITPDVLAIAFGLAAVLLGRGRLFVRDWIPFIGLFLAYELMRGYADDLGGAAHVADVLALERWLFLGALPTQVLQDWLRPATGTDPVAVLATIMYMLHFPLPVAVAFGLWVRRRREYYDFVAALILLSMAAFATYLLLPVAPPWWAADAGLINGPDGSPAIAYLKGTAFDAIAAFFGFDGSYLYSYALYDINPNAVAAFPSLHGAYPVLAFLFVRRAVGRRGWVVLAYAALVWFSVVYLADHYVVDLIGGLVYAVLAYVAITRAPSGFKRFVDRAAELRGAGFGDGAGVRGMGSAHVPLVQGLVTAAIGAAVLMIMAWGDVLGGSTTPLFLVPWAAVIGGLWRAARALSAR